MPSGTYVPGGILHSKGSLIDLMPTRTVNLAEMRESVATFATTKHSGGFKSDRFPRAVIAYAVRADFRFSISLRDKGDLSAERGIVAS